ncbi:carbohydrate ABC transporter permease [Paenibacillus thalictri]|uniref:Sugar ABC transporter permease n=1 Tax=Paenibacillus thalictri TaxID=2527873 RepID=A0A4Q9DI06_9BACL|nr:sugar ABC transporter permease [Paenibacillus thalictri]TBL71616.1 sugar ABC transporter permease [Paenibacillus thalictri]
MKRKRWLSAAAVRKLEGSIMIAPWVTGFLVFIAFPLCYSLYMSFNNVKITASAIEYSPVGLKYYREILLADGGLLYNDLFPFLRQSVIMIPVIVVFSLLVAILLNQRFRGRALFRAVFFLPVIFSTGQIISEFITQGEGVLSFVEQFQLADYAAEYLPAAWAAPVVKVLSSFVLVLWYSGVQILIFLAGRQTISKSVYEAARIDGADPWETFWKITLPGLSPFIMLNSIYSVVDLFTFPSNPIIAKVNTSNYGLSSALAWIYLLIVMLFLGLIFYVFARLNRSTRPI